MCGIAGVVRRNGAPEVDALRRMRARLSHRGPDSSGEHIDGAVALSHTRLSIIDLASGQQPLFGADGGHCLIANAEIYNFPEMRATLEREGHGFATHSDCEVILPLYVRHGDDCVKHLRGMFAFALWDRLRRRLLLARDRMGEKPIYYYFDGERLVFASELKALVASGLVTPRIDRRSVGRYFRYQYVPEPETALDGIRKVPAGSVLTLDLDAWTLKVSRYWSAWDAPAIDDDPVARIRASLEDAVRVSLLSDVPIGISLSGGIDSSLLACLMRAGTNRSIQAIGIGYRDAEAFDERPQARVLAQKLNMDFHEVEIDDGEMLDLFPEVAAKRDDPIGDIAGVNYYTIMAHAQARGIKVMFQGHGLDELFWGYGWVKDAVALNEGAGRVLLHGLAGCRPWRDRLRALRRWVASAGVRQHFQMYELQPYSSWVLRNARNLFTPRFLEESGFLEATAESEYGRLTLRTDLEITRLIVEFYLRENGIVQGDRLSMANSVELRLPFVDHKLVETAVGLRKMRRDDHLPLKHRLKQSILGILPNDVLNRPKRGFTPPVLRWERALRERYGEKLRDGILVEERIIDPALAQRLSRPDVSDPAESTVSRMALTLELWARGTVLGAVP